MKRIAVILAIVYMFAACFACRTTRVIVPDYSAYISNLFRYYVSDGLDLTDGDVADIEEHLVRHAVLPQLSVDKASDG